VVLYRAVGDKSYFFVALISLSLRLSGLGRHEEALRASEEALIIHRSLAADHPEIFRPNLAVSLSNHFIRLSR
jgi:hypothetical protein